MNKNAMKYSLRNPQLNFDPLPWICNNLHPWSFTSWASGISGKEDSGAWIRSWHARDQSPQDPANEGVHLHRLPPQGPQLSPLQFENQFSDRKRFRERDERNGEVYRAWTGLCFQGIEGRGFYFWKASKFFESCNVTFKVDKSSLTISRWIKSDGEATHEKFIKS